jgi:hypothetical protein
MALLSFRGISTRAYRLKASNAAPPISTFPGAIPIGREDTIVSYRSAKQSSDWWPAGLGTPSAVGAQNDLRYAVFPRRLAIKDGDRVEVYDTGNHRIFGVAQAQSADQTLTFTSQNGLVRVRDLPKVRE